MTYVAAENRNASIPYRRVGRSGLVLPSLALNYLGQGALLMHDPKAIENPFYRLFPTEWMVPAVVLATLAAGLASGLALPVAARLGIPILRAGFPIHDVAGAPARQWIGYAGSRQTLFDLYNLLIGQRQALAPYRSIFWQGGPRDQETAALALA